MESIASIPVFTLRQKACIAVLGLVTVVTMGIAACIALILALFYLVIHLALLTLQAGIEALSALGTTYLTADPLIKFLLLVFFAYALYRIATRKGRRQL